ncbi:MAG: hypothetical protein NWF02_06645 [Candidatus Bathyarchaeota archaeon]|nr:hypothetical protein [Candidatus Bathyarchaeum sp.]
MPATAYYVGIFLNPEASIGTTLFGSRTREAINLGIGMTLINYVLVGLAFFGDGAALFVRNRMHANSDRQIVMQ